MQALAAATPPFARRRAELDDLAAKLAERIRVDTANLSIDNLEISSKQKFSKKTTPADALQTLPAEGKLSEQHACTYKFYLRKFGDIICGVQKNSKEWAALTKVAKALNVEIKHAPADDVNSLFARLRALDMVDRPLL